MNKTILRKFGYVVAITLFAALFALPSSSFGDTSLAKKLENFTITLGLDLAGGTELDYEIDLSDAIAQNSDENPENDVNIEQIAESVRDALEKRVNPAGVGEIVVKRSQVDGEEHVLIQMPPSSNVEQAKNDAEQDNRLEFFEENPALEAASREAFQKIRGKITSANWNNEIAKLKTDSAVVYKDIAEKRFKDEITDQSLAEKLIALAPGQIVSGLVDTQTELEYTLDENGQLQVRELPKKVIAMARLNTKDFIEREKTVPAEVDARHILFAYPGATRAGEDVKYTSKEEAKKEAQKMLQTLQENGTADFETLAKEYSTEAAAQESGGNLGKFGKGKMIQEFEEAVFGAASKGLIEYVVETDFGFHVIEVLDFAAEKTDLVSEPQITYEILGWLSDELGWEKTELGGAQLDVATVGFNEVGQPTVDLLFNEEGGALFAELTSNVAARKCNGSLCRLGIKVGGNWQTQATVREKIVGRRAQITGNFTFESSKALADGLNLGAIDAPVNLSGQNTILPDLGKEQLTKSLKAAALGLLATMIFMTISYRLGGLVASFALALYAAMFVAILKLWPESFGGPIVLSLSGMAGIALSIGLAVDANILIFERMKEEIRKGKGLHSSIDLGFERAWSAILDSNTTTLITCLILFNLGSSMIRGFAITLILGTLLSMFTAVTVSRALLHTILLWKPAQNPALFAAVKRITKK